MSIFWIGALMIAVKLESTIWLVVMTWTPHCFARRLKLRPHGPVAKTCATQSQAFAGWKRVSSDGAVRPPVGERTVRLKSMEPAAEGPAYLRAEERSARSDFRPR